MPEPKKLSREQYLTGIYEALGGFKSQGVSLDDFKTNLASDPAYVENIYKGLGGQNMVGDFDKFTKIVSGQPVVPAAAPQAGAPMSTGFTPVDVKKKLTPSDAFASAGPSTSWTDPSAVSKTVRGFVTPVASPERLAELKTSTETGIKMQKDLGAKVSALSTEITTGFDEFIADATARGAVTIDNNTYAFSNEDDLAKFKDFQARLDFTENEKLRYNEVSGELTNKIGEYEAALASQIYKEAEKSAPREAFDENGNWVSAGFYSLMKGTGDAVTGMGQIVADFALEAMINGGRGVALSNKAVAGAPQKDLSQLEEGARRSVSQSFQGAREGYEDYLRVLSLVGGPGVPVGAIASPEYVNRLSNSSWLGGAYVGAMQSVPAMLTPGMVGMTGQMYGFMADEIESDAELAQIPEEHKLLLKSTTGVIMASLERLGFRNLVANKSIVKNIALNVIKKLPVGTPTKVALERIAAAEARSITANLGIRAATGFAAEYETGALQQLADVTTKSIYDTAVEKDMFNNPTGIGEIAYEVNKAGVQEGMGAIIIGGRSMVTGAIRDNKLGDLMENGEFYNFEMALRNPKLFQEQMTAINNAIGAGKITEAEGAEQIGAMAKAQMVAEMMPSRTLNRYNQLEARRKVFDLLSQKLDLRTELEKADETLKPAVQAEIEKINDEVRGIVEGMEAQVEEFGAAIPETTRGEQAPTFTAGELSGASYTDVLSKLYKAPTPEQRSTVRRMMEQLKGMAQVAGGDVRFVVAPQETARFGPSRSAMFFDQNTNTIFVNTNAYVDNVYAHEASHPFIEFLKNSNPEGFAEVFSAVKDVEMPKGAAADLAKRFNLTPEQQAQLEDVKTYGEWSAAIKEVFPDQDFEIEAVTELMADLFEAKINTKNAPSARRALGTLFEYMGLNTLSDKMYNIEEVTLDEAIGELERQDFFSEESIDALTKALKRDDTQKGEQVPSPVEGGEAAVETPIEEGRPEAPATGGDVQATQAEVAPVAAPAAPAPATVPAAPVAEAPTSKKREPKKKTEEKDEVVREAPKADAPTLVAAPAAKSGGWNIVDKETGDVLGTIQRTGKGKKSVYEIKDAEGNAVGTAKSSTKAAQTFKEGAKVEFVKRTPTEAPAPKQEAKKEEAPARPERKKPREVAQAPQKGERVVVYGKPIQKFVEDDKFKAKKAAIESKRKAELATATSEDAKSKINQKYDDQIAKLIPGREIPVQTVMDNQTGDIMGTIEATVGDRAAKTSDKNVTYTAKDTDGNVVGTSDSVEGAAKAITPYTTIEFKKTETKPEPQPFTPKAAPAPTRVVEDGPATASTAADATAAAKAREDKDRVSTLLGVVAKLSLKDIIATKAPRRRKVTEQIEVMKDGKKWRVYEPQRLRRGTYLEDGTIRWYAFKNESDFTVDYVRNFPTERRKTVADQLREKFDNVTEETPVEAKPRPEVTAEQMGVQSQGGLTIVELLRDLGKRGKEVAVVVNPNTMTISEREPRRKVFIETKYTDKKKFNASVKALQERINSGELDFQEEVKTRMAALQLDLSQDVTAIIDEETDLLLREAKVAAARAKRLNDEKARIRRENVSVAKETPVAKDIEEGLSKMSVQAPISRVSDTVNQKIKNIIKQVKATDDIRTSGAMRGVIAFAEKSNSVQPGTYKQEKGGLSAEFNAAVDAMNGTVADYLRALHVFYANSVQMTPEQLGLYNFFDVKQRDEIKTRLASRYSPFIPTGLLNQVFENLPAVENPNTISSIVFPSFVGGYNIQKDLISTAIVTAKTSLGEELIEMTLEDGVEVFRLTDLTEMQYLIHAQIDQQYADLSTEEKNMLYEDIMEAKFDATVIEGRSIAKELMDVVESIKGSLVNEFNRMGEAYFNDKGISPIQNNAFSRDFLEYAYVIGSMEGAYNYINLTYDFASPDALDRVHGLMMSIVDKAITSNTEIRVVPGAAPTIAPLGFIQKLGYINGESPISKLARVVSSDIEDVEFSVGSEAKNVAAEMAMSLANEGMADSESALAGMLMAGNPESALEIKGLSPDEVMSGEGGLVRARQINLDEAPRIGSKFGNIKDIAELFSFFRSTVQENGIIVEVDKDGRLVDYRVFTNKMFGQVALNDFAKLIYTKKQQPENKIFTIHNHPTDIPAPSNSDLQSHLVFNDVLGDSYGGQIILNGEKFSFVPPLNNYDLIGDSFEKVPVTYAKYTPAKTGPTGIRLNTLGFGNVIAAGELNLPKALLEQVHILNSSAALSSNPGFTNIALVTVNNSYIAQELVLKDVNFLYVSTKNGKANQEELDNAIASIRRTTESGLGKYTVAIMTEGSNPQVMEAVKSVATHIAIGNERNNEIVFAPSDKFVRRATPAASAEITINKKLADELSYNFVPKPGYIADLELNRYFVNDDNFSVSMGNKEMNLTEFVNQFTNDVFERAGVEKPLGLTGMTDLDVIVSDKSTPETIISDVMTKTGEMISQFMPKTNGVTPVDQVMMDYEAKLAEGKVAPKYNENVRFSSYKPSNTAFSQKFNTVRSEQRRIVDSAKAPVAKRFREGVLDKKVGIFNFINKNLNGRNAEAAEMLQAYVRTEGGKSIYASKLAEEKLREVFGKNVLNVSSVEMQEVEETLMARTIIEIQDRRDAMLAKQYKRKEDALAGVTLQQIKSELETSREYRSDLRARIKRSERNLEAAIRTGDLAKQAQLNSDILTYTSELVKVEATASDLAKRVSVITGSTTRIQELQDPIKNPGGMTYEQANEHLEQRKKDNPELSKYANSVVDKMFEETKRILKEKFDSGLISQGIYDALKDYGYSPRIVLQRLVDREMMSELGVLSQNPSNGVKKLGAGTEDAMVTDPTALFAATIVSHERTMRRNEIAARLYDFVVASPANNVLSIEQPLLNKDGSIKRDRFGVIQYPPKIAPGTTVIEFFDKNNNVVRMRVDLEFYKTWRGLETWGAGTEGQKMFMELLGVATGSTGLKLAATIGNPAFAAVNVFRDFLFVNAFTNAFGNTLTGSMANYIKYASPIAVNRLFGDRSVSKAAEKGGYAMDFVSDSPLGFRNVSKGITERRTGDKANKVSLALTYIKEGMLFLQEKSEKITRLAIFEKTYRDLKAARPNLTEDELVTLAAAKARQHMDYAISGQASYMVEKFLPYTNAATRAIETSVYYISPLAGNKMFGTRVSEDNNMVNAWSFLKIAEFAVGYAAIMAFNNMIGEPDDEFDENGEKRPHALDYFSPQIKDRNIVVLNGKWKDKNTGEYVQGWSKSAVPEAFVIGIPYEMAPFVRLTQAVADSVNPMFSDRHPSNLKSAVVLGAEYYIPLLGQSAAKGIENKSVVDAMLGMVGQVPMVGAYIAYSANYDTYTGDEVFREGFGELADTDKYDDRTRATFVRLGKGIGAKPKQLQAAFEKLATRVDNQYFLRMLFSATDNISYEALIEEGVVQGTIRPAENIGDILKAGGGVTKRVVRDGNLGWQAAFQYDSLEKSTAEENTRSRVRRDIKAIASRWEADNHKDVTKEALDRITRSYDMTSDEAESMAKYYFAEIARMNMLSPQAQTVVRANSPQKRAEILTQIEQKDGREALVKALQQIQKYEDGSGETIISDKTLEKFLEYRGE